MSGGDVSGGDVSGGDVRRRISADDRRTGASLAVLALFVVAIGTLAWSWNRVQSSGAEFGDTEVFDGNHLGAGTVDIGLGDGTVQFEVVDMAAGDVQDGRLVVTNQGTLPLRYSVTAASTGGPLADALEVALWLGADAACSGPQPPTWLRPAELATALDSVASPTAPRPLAPGDAEVLCMLGRLPLSTPSSAQGQQLELSFVIAAEHDLTVDESGTAS